MDKLLIWRKSGKNILSRINGNTVFVIKGNTEKCDLTIKHKAKKLATYRNLTRKDAFDKAREFEQLNTQGNEHTKRY